MPTLFEAPTVKPEKPVKSGKTPKHSDMGKPYISTAMSALASYAIRPKDIHFETQETGEEVVLFLRQHIILLIPWLVLGVILLFVPTVGIPYILRFSRIPIDIPAGYWIIGGLFWYIAVFGFILSHVIHWFFNIFIVTNERIVDIDFVNLLFKEFSEAKLPRIQDISYQTKGLFATFFNYGDVLIQTAGEVPNFIFESVPRPDDVVHIIGDLVKQNKGIDV